MSEVAPRFRCAHLVVAAVIAVLGAIGTGSFASAHTDFVSSMPTDGAVVEGPLTEVVVNFTNPASPSGAGFELLEPSGTLRAPSSLDETDGTSFVMTFDPPLTAGTYGVRWKVQAGDAHPIDGAFQFEIVGAATGNVAAPPATVTTDTSMVMDDMTTAEMDMDGAEHSTMTDATLDDFLDTGSTSDDSTNAGRIGRSLSILGTIFGVGGLAALIWTVRGRRDELSTQIAWIRLAGLVVFTGGFIEFALLGSIDPAASVADLLTTKPGTATALKMAGGLAALIGFHGGAGRIVAPTRSLSAATAIDLPRGRQAKNSPTLSEEPGDDGFRWSPTSSAALGLAGYALVLISFWFDGHTVSRGPWAIHSIVNFVHLGAAAVWGGGVFTMATMALMRRRRSEHVGLAAMVVRFSSVATASLVAVIIAGLVMTWMILDTPGDVFATPWGRILIAKTLVVAVAAGLGGYNHFRLRPALEQRPNDPALARHLRVSLGIESVAFVAIVALTSVLVASAT